MAATCCCPGQTACMAPVSDRERPVLPARSGPDMARVSASPAGVGSVSSPTASAASPQGASAVLVLVRPKFIVEPAVREEPASASIVEQAGRLGL